MLFFAVQKLPQCFCRRNGHSRRLAKFLFRRRFYGFHSLKMLHKSRRAFRSYAFRFCDDHFKIGFGVLLTAVTDGLVPPSSHRVSRVRRYFGYYSLTQSFVYRTLTFFGRPSHAVQLNLVNAKCSPKPLKDCSSRFSLFRFRSPLLSESRLISFPRPT